MLALLAWMIFGQTTLACAAAQSPQTCNAFEGFKLIQEGQRLTEAGNRVSLAQATDKFKAAYECFRKDNLKMGMGLALVASASTYSALRQNRQALDAFLEAATYAKESKDSAIYAMTLAGIGMAYSQLSEAKPAIEYLNQALALLHSEQNPQMASPMLCALGGVYIQLGQKQKGLEYLNQALDLAQKVHDFSLEIHIRLLISAALSSLGQPHKALESAELVLQMARERKDRPSEASALVTIGGVQDSLGDRQAALRDYNEALRIGRETPGWSGATTVLGNMAGVYSGLGESDRAIALYEESIKISEAEGTPEEAGTALNGLAIIYQLRAEPLKALSYHQRSLELARQVKDRSKEAAALANIAVVYESFKQYEQALKADTDAVAILHAMEDPAQEAFTLSNLGTVYTQLHRFREALDCFNRALELQRVSENRDGQAHTLLKMADAHKEAGDVVKALDAYTAALALMTAVEDRVGEAMISNNLGFIYDRQNDYAKASEYYSRALSLARFTGDLRGESTILSNLGHLYEKQGNLKEAEAQYERAIATRERVRTAAHLDEFKATIADDSAELYAHALVLKIKAGKTAEAFELSERAKARMLLDQMNSARIDMRKSADRELIEQEQSLRFELASLEKQLGAEMAKGAGPEACAPLQERLKQGRQAYAELIIRLKANNPEYAELQGYSPRSLAEIQRLLDPNTTLLSYHVTAIKTFAFVVTRDSLNVVEIPAGEADLRNTIDWFRSFANLQTSEPASLKRLNDWLIAPVNPYIKTSTVLVIPHGVLHQLPFAALYDGKGYFGEQHTIYYLPDASLLPLVKSGGPQKSYRLLAMAEANAVGMPSLKYVDQESQTLARLYGGKALLSGQASKSEFLRLAADYDILHIASHAELNTRSPLFSRILLTPDQDGRQGLEVREVYDLNLSHTDLVVLSACETQLGAQGRGDDIVGLNRAFIYAGASSVIASLWTVDDRATGRLMRSFYTHLKQGRGKAEALRLAQAETRRQYPNPYYWAAFVLTGDAGHPEPGRAGGSYRKKVWQQK